MHPAYDKPLPEGWTGGAPVTKYWGGNYVHLYRLTRPCATCGAEISLDVTKGALEGRKKNAGLLLRNCPKCRAERKAGGVGSRGGRSRPVAGESVTTAAAGVDNSEAAAALRAELETLRTANATMKEELAGLYAQIKELSAKPVAPPTPVRVHKLPPEPLTMAESTKALLSKNNVKMPWEGS